MKEVFTEDEKNVTLKEYNKTMIGKKYILFDHFITVTELIEEKMSNGMYRIQVVTNSPYSDELYNVYKTWPLDLNFL